MRAIYGDHSYVVTQLEVRISLNCDIVILLKLQADQDLSNTIKLGGKINLKTESDNCVTTVYAEALLSSSTICCRREPLPEATRAMDRPLLIQRQADKAGTLSFLERLLPSTYPLERQNASEINTENLQQLFPDGSCFLFHKGELPRERVNKVFQHIQRSNPEVIGYARGLSGNWRLASFHLSDTSPTCSDEEWKLAPTLNQSINEGRFSLSTGREFENENDVAALISQWTEDNNITLQLREEYTIPLFPQSVRYHDAHYFCSDLQFIFTFPNQIEDGDEEANENNPSLSCTLCLNHYERYQPQLPSTHNDQPTLLLGNFQRWDDNKHRLLLTNIVLFENNTAVNLGEETDVLTSHWLAPGYVRESYSAFYACLQEGDQLILQCSNGARPLILGALQQQRAELDDSDTELSLCAEGLSLSTTSDVPAKILLNGSAIKGISEKEITLITKAFKVGKDESSHQLNVTPELVTIMDQVEIS